MVSTQMPPVVQRLHFDNMNIKQTYSRSDDSLTGRESSLQRKLRAKAMKHQNLQLCDESKKKHFHVLFFHELLLVFLFFFTACIDTDKKADVKEKTRRNDGGSHVTIN